jgi:hypothetical protein
LSINDCISVRTITVFYNRRGRSGIYSKIRKLGRKTLKKNQESIQKSGIVKFILVFLFRIKFAEKWMKKSWLVRIKIYVASINVKPVYVTSADKNLSFLFNFMLSYFTSNLLPSTDMT